MDHFHQMKLYNTNNSIHILVQEGPNTFIGQYAKNMNYTLKKVCQINMSFICQASLMQSLGICRS